MRRLFVFFFIFTFLYLNANAAIYVDNGLFSEIIGQQVSILDSKKELSFQEVINSKEFKPSSKAIISLGNCKNSVWLKFTVVNKSSKDHLLLKLDYPLIDSVALFIPGANNNYQIKRSGESIPYSMREFKPPFILFDLNVAQGQTKTYYLRVKGVSQIILPLSIVTPKSLWLESFKENLIIGVFMGIVLIMAVYNFFLYLSTKDKNYLLYVLFIIFVGLTQLGIAGYNSFFFWREDLILGQNSTVIFACLGGIFALMFTLSFLQIKKYSSFGRIIGLVLIMLFSLSIILQIIGFKRAAFNIMHLNTGAEAIYIFVISLLIMLKRRTVPVIIFFISWGILTISSAIFILKDLNILPYNSLTHFSFKLGFIIEIALLSFALAYRINILKKEREESHLETLRLANENRRILSEQNIMLEKQVSERTQELFDKNVALHAVNKHLKETQSQLVATEKMSSLGQLTAGIAHEINNPINFVSANISPLKRDVKQLFDTIYKIESIGLEKGKAAAAKLREMAAYKEAQELDELQEEIDLLLNGIHDGASRTASIVRGLRLFSRLDEDAWKEADLNEGIESTLAITGNILKGIEVNTQLGDIPAVTCFPGKLNQVFLNIITNAAFAIRQRHGDNIGGRLDIKTWQEGDFVFVSIKDDGIGMDEATLSRLYDPFFTTKPVGEGTGLGMSIVFTIVEQHHARLKVTSAAGKGTEFTLKLYVHPPAAEPA